MKRLIVLLLTTAFVFAGENSLAVAADSVSVPGQVSVDQCPEGYQYSTGISVNVTTHEFTTICNAPPNAEDVLRAQQDQDFRARQDAAIAAANAESQAWNAANPGQQKCVQWGPIVHANGISTASGGACANPVAVPEGESTPTQSTPPISGDVALRDPVTVAPSDMPFSVQVSGQIGTEGCPVGYQAANGLEVNATTGQVSTVCWSESAWQAWRLGGDTWSQFVATGGAVDVNLELERRAAVAALKTQAHQVAQAAADSTPGLKRCTSWSGYGESGEECAYTFVAPSLSAPASETTGDTSRAVPQDTEVVSAGEQVLTSLVTMSVAVTKSSLTAKPKAALLAYFSKLKKSVWVPSKKAITLPALAIGNVSYRSSNSRICTVKGRVVTKKSSGTCTILTVVTVNPWTKFSTSKQYVLKK